MRIFIPAIIIIILIVAIIFILTRGLGVDVNQSQGENMEITSSAFKNETEIPAKYTCNGENINPPLSFEDVPRQAQSLVLVMDDPDAPSGVFTHWLLWNIDPKITGIAENSVPDSAIQGQNYTGPCPPSGTHHYFFKLSALDSKLDLQPNITEQDLENALQGHILDEAELVGLFSKQ